MKGYRLLSSRQILNKECCNFSKRPMMPGMVRLIRSERSPSVLVETVLFLNHHLRFCKTMLRNEISSSCNGLVHDIPSGECNFPAFEDYLRLNLDRLCLTVLQFCHTAIFYVVPPCLKKSNLNSRLW